MEQKHKHPRRVPRLWFWILPCLALAGIMTGEWWIVSSGVQHQLAVLRAQGMPTSSEESRAYVRIPDGETDTTGVWHTALMTSETIKAHPLTKVLPVVGTSRRLQVPAAGQPWDQFDAACQWTRDLAPQFVLIRKAAESGGVAPCLMNPTDDVDHVMQTVGHLRTIADALRLDVHVAAHQHDDERAFRDCRDLFSVSNMLRAESAELSNLLRQVLYIIAVSQTNESAPQSNWSDPQLVELQIAASVGNFRTELRSALCGARGSCLSSIDELSPRVLGSWRKRLALSEYRIMIDAMEDEWPEILRRMDSLNTQRKSLTDSRMKRAMNSAVMEMIPGHTKNAIQGARCEARRRCILLALAARRFRLVHESYPEDVSILRQFLPAATGDVFEDPFCGQPLIYRRQGDQFLIYSVAEDQSDDGGDIEQTGDLMLRKDIGVRW